MDWEDRRRKGETNTTKQKERQKKKKIKQTNRHWELEEARSFARLSFFLHLFLVVNITRSIRLLSSWPHRTPLVSSAALVPRTQDFHFHKWPHPRRQTGTLFCISAYSFPFAGSIPFVQIHGVEVLPLAFQFWFHLHPPQPYCLWIIWVEREAPRECAAQRMPIPAFSSDLERRLVSPKLCRHFPYRTNINWSGIKKIERKKEKSSLSPWRNPNKVCTSRRKKYLEEKKGLKHKEKKLRSKGQIQIEATRWVD